MSPIPESILKLQAKLTRWKDKDYDKKYEAIVCRLLRETAGLIEGEMAARTQVGLKLQAVKDSDGLVIGHKPLDGTEDCFKPEWWAKKGGE